MIPSNKRTRPSLTRNRQVSLQLSEFLSVPRPFQDESQDWNQSEAVHGDCFPGPEGVLWEKQ